MNKPLMPASYLAPDDVRKTVKVRVGYRDGSHWLETYTDEMAKLGLAYVEIDQHTWEQWKSFCASARLWESFCHARGAEQYEKEHAHEATN